MIYIQTENAQRTLKQLGVRLSKAQADKAGIRAINTALRKANTIARREVKVLYNISQKDLDGVKVERANMRSMTGKIVASRKPIPISAFAPKQETSAGRVSISRRGAVIKKSFKRAKVNTQSGVSVEIRKGKREVIPFAFLLAGGAAQVFARGAYKDKKIFVQRHHRVSKEGNDIPVKPLITVSVFGTAINNQVQQRMGREVRVFYTSEYSRLVGLMASGVLP
jgi:hypothetical protein